MSLQIQIGREASQRTLTIKSFTLDESIKLELLSEIAEVLDENLSTSIDGNRVLFDMNSLKESLKKAYN